MCKCVCVWSPDACFSLRKVTISQAQQPTQSCVCVVVAVVAAITVAVAVAVNWVILSKRTRTDTKDHITLRWRSITVDYNVEQLNKDRLGADRYARPNANAKQSSRDCVTPLPQRLLLCGYAVAGRVPRAAGPGRRHDSDGNWVSSVGEPMCIWLWRRGASPDGGAAPTECK